MPYTMRLAGKSIVMLVDEGVHDHEFWYPYYRFREEGARVVVAGLATGTVLGEGRHGKDGLPLDITHTIAQAAGIAFDCLYLPGGIYNTLSLRRDAATLAFVRDVMARNTLVAAICHGPWILASAGVLAGRRLTCPADMAADVIHAGGQYVAEPAVRDGNLITAVYYAYLPEHFRLLMPALLGECRA